MPVITRRQARTAATQCSSTGQNRQQESPEVQLATTVADHVHREYSPEVCRTKAQLIARCIQPSHMESLPAEIIELIAQRLRDHTFAEEDRNSADFPEAASDLTAHPPPCECQNEQKPPCQESNSVARIARFAPGDYSIPLSSTSRRFRQVVFDQRLHRIQVVKFCRHSMKMTADMSDALRSSVESLYIRATPRHIVPSVIQLKHLLYLYPDTNDLEVLWERAASLTSLAPSEDIHDFPGLTHFTVNVWNGSIPGNPPPIAAHGHPANYTFASNLDMILKHLPLAHVEGVIVNASDWMKSQSVETEAQRLAGTLQAMRFPRLDRLEVSVRMQVLFPLVVDSIWDELEKNFKDALQQDTLQDIILDVSYFIMGCHHALSYANVFLPLEDDHATVSPTLVPTRDRLERLFETFKTSGKQLRELKVIVTGCFSLYDRNEIFDLLNFRMSKGSAEFDDGVVYKVNQEGIDLIAGIIRKRFDEDEESDEQEIGSDEESDEDEGSDDGQESTEDGSIDNNGE